MTIAVKHAFNSTKSDGADPTLVQPSNWNDDHVLSQMPGTILGAVSAGGGQTIELPVSVGSDGYTAIGTTTAVRLAVGTSGQRPVTPSAGDLRFNSSSVAYEYYNGTLWVTLGATPTPTGACTGFSGKKTSCPAGWVTSDGGTIGNASSNGTNRKDPDTQDLFTLLFNDYSDAALPMQTSGGVVVPRSTYANAAAAFAANSAMPTPNYSDCFRIGLGTIAVTPGATGGAMTATLTVANLPPHVHTDPASVHTFNNNVGGGGLPNYDNPGPSGDGSDHGLANTPFSVQNSYIGELVIIKL